MNSNELMMLVAAALRAKNLRALHALMFQTFLMPKSEERRAQLAILMTTIETVTLLKILQ